MRHREITPRGGATTEPRSPRNGDERRGQVCGRRRSLAGQQQATRLLGFRLGALVLGILALALLMADGARAAANLVPNPGFDADAAGWAPLAAFQGSVGHSPVDEQGEGGSGSLRLFALQPGPWQGNVTSSCFPVTAGEDIVFGGSVHTPGFLGASSANVLISFYSDGGCAQGTSGHSFAKLVTNHGTHTWRPTQGYTEIPAAAQSALLHFVVALHVVVPAEILVDNAFAYEGATCASSGLVVCLNEGRFRVDVQWNAGGIGYGYGTLSAFSGGLDDSAHAWFFAPSNVEVVVKVLDGCAYNDRYWVFAAGLTNVKVNLRVRDTHTGETWHYEHLAGEPFPPVQDIGAFATCS